MVRRGKKVIMDVPVGVFQSAMLVGGGRDEARLVLCGGGLGVACKQPPKVLLGEKSARGWECLCLFVLWEEVVKGLAAAKA